jgi:hypothetical protein
LALPVFETIKNKKAREISLVCGVMVQMRTKDRDVCDMRKGRTKESRQRSPKIAITKETVTIKKK